MKTIQKIALFLGTIAVISVGTYYSYRCIRITQPLIPAPYTQIAFVNLSRVNTEAQAVKHFKELIERQYKNFHEEILAKEKNLQIEYNKIHQLEKANPEQAKELKKQKDILDRQVSDLDKTLRDRKESLNKSFAHIQEEIEQTIRDIVNDVAKKRGLNLVFNATILDASVVLYGGSELDITDEVLQELNHKLPTVHLPA